MESEDVPGGETRLFELDRLARLLLRLGSRTFAHFGSVAGEMGLAPPVAMALQRIEPARPGPMNELAGAMGCDPSYVTWIADQLEAQGLAERRLAPRDRRVKVLALTDAGIARRERLLDELARLPFALDQLSPAEAETLGALVSRILDQDPSDGPAGCARTGLRQTGDQRQQATRRNGAPPGEA